MSTKTTIKHGDDWHLYGEYFDTMGEPSSAPPPFVYLTLSNVRFAAECNLPNGGTMVDIQIPYQTAVELGLVQPAAEVVSKTPI